MNVHSLKGGQAEVKRQLLVDIVARNIRNGYDILLLQETSVNRDCVESVDGYKFFFSTDVKEQEVVATQKRLDDGLAKGEGISTVQRTDTERAGVGIILFKYIKHFLLDVNQINGRIMSVKLKSKGRNLNFVSCYAPHSGYSTEDKVAFWDKLATLENQRSALYWRTHECTAASSFSSGRECHGTKHFRKRVTLFENSWRTDLYSYSSVSKPT